MPRASILIWIVVVLVSGCAAGPSPIVEVDRPVTEAEAIAVVEALRTAAPNDSVKLYFISGDTATGSIVEWNDGVITMNAHAQGGDFETSLQTFQLKYVRKVDVIAMRTEFQEGQ